MSIATTQFHTRVVDCSSDLLTLLELVKDVPTLYLDLEGRCLSRDGTISILTLYAASIRIVFIIDIYKMGRSAFSTATSSDTTLKSILESPYVEKVIFDVRNDSDALFAHFQISLDNVWDLQLMELAARKGSRQFVAGLAKCIEIHSPISTTEKIEWKQQKERTGRLFDPTKGGRYEVFEDRPFQKHIIEYCVGDVVLLPGLYDFYNNSLSGPWRERIRAKTLDRIQESQSAAYDPHSDMKALGPWNESVEGADGDAWNPLREEEDQDLNIAWYSTSGEEDDWYPDTARDCIGWEDDMIQHGSPF